VEQRQTNEEMRWATGWGLQCARWVSAQVRSMRRAIVPSNWIYL